MQIQRKEIDIELNGKNYKAVLDFGAAIEFEGLTKKSILVEIQNIATTQSMTTLACLMASVIKKENNKSLGMKEIEKIDLIGGLTYFMAKMEELFENSLPKDDEIDDEEVKKKIEEAAEMKID